MIEFENDSIETVAPVETRAEALEDMPPGVETHLTAVPEEFVRAAESGTSPVFGIIVLALLAPDLGIWDWLVSIVTLTAAVFTVDVCRPDLLVEIEGMTP